MQWGLSAALLGAAVIALSGCGTLQQLAQMNDLAAPIVASEEHPQLPAELEKARAEGIPTDLSHVFAKVPAAKDNAAPIYDAIRAELKRRPISLADAVAFDRIRKPAPPADALPRVRRVMRDHRHLMALIHEAASRPGFGFVHTMRGGDPSTMLFPHLATMREATRLLTAQSILMAYDGHPLEAVRNQEAGFRIARQASADPLAIQHLVSAAIDSITLTGMRRILTLSSGDPTVAAEGGKVVTVDMRPWPVSTVVRSEAAYALSEYRYIASQGPTKGPSVLAAASGASSTPELSPMSPHEWNALMDANGATLVRLYREELEVADLPYPASKPAENAVTDTLDTATGLNQLLAAILVPNVGGLETKRAEAGADTAITVGAADVVVWRARHGRFPDTLAEAMTKPPIDPFDLKPLRYRREGDGFVVYSIGRSLKYDGHRLMTGEYELVFRYPEPKVPH